MCSKCPLWDYELTCGHTVVREDPPYSGLTVHCKVCGEYRDFVTVAFGNPMAFVLKKTLGIEVEPLWWYRRGDEPTEEDQ